ncbi:helix-turn-helix domain-containing protein, partial [Mesorhizobium sp. M7A.F.Ca.US.005.03.2.1]|uniref:helix-turn-helix domain-containing protein n=1 Tax=Mesorhizobium sp. M7A.F.Ca.US.005.03.2.1 TaxID=2496737 RepID=UPI001FDFBEC7
MSERGRPRTFDRTAALRRAMQVFWARGYEGASMSELTAAMGINSPSLYAAFGNTALQTFLQGGVVFGTTAAQIVADGAAARILMQCAQRDQAALRAIALRIGFRRQAQELFDRLPRGRSLVQCQPDVGTLGVRVKIRRLQEQRLLAAEG